MKPLLAGTLIAFAMGAFSSGRLPIRKQESGAAVKRFGILDSETAVFDGKPGLVFGKQESGRR